MSEIAILGRERIDELAKKVAHGTGVREPMVLIFKDATDIFALLFKLADRSGGEVLVAGHVSPDVAIAADRADLKLTEVFGSSPFQGDSAKVMEAISRGDETVYLANPNRVTGAGYGLAELDAVARVIPRGTLILDEYYWDLYGITGVPLLHQFTNVVVVRSFTAAFGVSSDESGFIIAEPDLIENVKRSFRWRRVSSKVGKIVTTALANDTSQGQRLKTLHDESLRVATALTRLGIQNRITPTDFLLLRVADPKRVGNFLTSQQVAIENLDGYPGLKHYIRYTMQSEYSNDNLLNAFKKMPTAYYRMKSIDRRAIVLQSRPQGVTECQVGCNQSETLGKRRLSVGQSRTVAADEGDL